MYGTQAMPGIQQASRRQLAAADCPSVTSTVSVLDSGKGGPNADPEKWFGSAVRHNSAFAHAPRS